MTGAALQKAKAPVSRARPLHPKDILIHLSLANLCYLRVWLPLLDHDYAAAVMNHYPRPVWLIGAMANVVGLAALLTAVTSFVRNHSGAFWQRLGRVLFAAALLPPGADFLWLASKKWGF